jgi:very-short-patch-repair endonuclease
VRSAIDRISKSARLVANHFGLPDPRTLHEARRIEALAASIPLDGMLQPQWFDAKRADEAVALVATISARMASAARTKRQLLVTHEESIFDIDVDGAITSYESGAFSRLLSSRYRKYRSEIKARARDKGSRSREQELALLRQVEAIKLHETWFESERGSFAIVLAATPDVSQAFNPGIFVDVQTGLDTAKRIQHQLGDVDLPAGFIEALCRPNPGRSVSGIRAKLATALDGVDQRLNRVAAIVDLSASLDGRSPEVSDAQELARSLDKFISRFSDLDEWLQAKRAMRRVEQAGIAGIVKALVSGDIPTDQWSDAVRRLVLTHALDAVQREDETLQAFNRVQHDDAISRFRATDVAYVEMSAARLKRSLAHRQGRISTAHGGEPVFLRAQRAKRRGQAPLRKVFERIPNLLPVLKPCLMMSPLSVAHFLPANLYKFDVVIFDEASQVRPYDAVGAIMRGKQLVVAGDEHQLPPTSFFDREIDDLNEESDNDIAGVESILKALQVKGMRSAYLNWHYRSQHEDLIAFSNHYFYGGRLITFPSAVSGPSPTRGVHFVHVQNGRYEEERDKVLKTPQRVNRAEAKRVAQLVVQHARTRPNESLGVVALGVNQRDIVEEEIKSARLLDQSLDDFFRPDREEPFFVKALEQVQGDERDVIIISIGYGKNAAGVLSHNFGPINQDGGERRLNVLVTRAKHQVVVASSIRAGDIDLDRTSKLGPRRLKNYLDFAERGPVALEAEITGGDGKYESPFEVEVGEALARAGYDVRRQVGTSGYRIDLAIVDPEQPGRYLLGIECDGATYHSSKTARDRDRLRQAILENLGWRMHRIWSTEWIRDAERELNRAIEQIELAKVSRVEPDAPFVSAPLIEDESSNRAAVQPVAPTDEAAALTADNYFIADLSRFVVADLLQTPLRLLSDAVVHCVTIEGPIHVELLTKRMTAEWGLQRAGVRIVNAIEHAISAAVAQGRIDRSGAFLRIPGTVVLGIRGEDEHGALRAVGHLPPEEIEKAFELILEHAFSLSEDELVLQTARLFGFRRTGAEIDRRFRESIHSTVERQRLELRNGRIQIRQE